GPGGEALHDLPRRLHLLDRDAATLAELQEPAESAEALRLAVHQLRVLLEGLEALAADGVLELGDGVRVVHVILAAAPPLVLAADIEDRPAGLRAGEGQPVPLERLARQRREA